jgi:RHS repeat-associated protein
MLTARSRAWVTLCLVLATLTFNAASATITAPNPNGSSTPLSTATCEFHSARGQLLLEYSPTDNEQTTEHIYLGDKRIAQRSFNTRTANATTCVFDITGEGNLSAEVDGLLITRYALGFRGANLIAGITTSPALNAATIEAKLLTLTTVPSGSPAGTKPVLDLDGDGRVLGSTDALMIHRFLKNIKDDALTSKAINPSGTRNATNLIQPYIATVCEKNPVPAGESISYFHNDVGGTPQAATDASGNVLWKETYKPYGERINNAIATQGGKGNNEIYFHGKKAETHLNGGVTLQYFGARYYDPSGARFMSIDPVGFGEGNIHSFNRYAYGNNNPFKFVDPDGMEGEPSFWSQSPVYAMGRAFGGLAAYAKGVATDDTNLKNAAIQGLSESREQLIEAAILVGSIRGGGRGGADATIAISRGRHPESAAHAEAAMRGGQPSVLTIDRSGASARRGDALKDTPRTAGKDRDEYPPAMFREGGAGASVRSIDRTDNRGAGGCIGAQCRGMADGTKVQIKVTE